MWGRDRVEGVGMTSMLATFFFLTGAAAADDIDQATVKALAKKLNGKLTYNKKAGELNVAYDFRSAKQMADFVGNPKPTLKGRLMVLDTNASVENLVKWKSVTISASLATDRMRGTLIKASGVHIHTGGANPDTFYLEVENKDRQYVIAPEKNRTGVIQFEATLSSDRVATTYATSRLASPGPGGNVGRISFFGGEHPWGWTNIVFRGVPDPKWIEEFIK